MGEEAHTAADNSSWDAVQKLLTNRVRSVPLDWLCAGYEESCSESQMNETLFHILAHILRELTGDLREEKNRFADIKIINLLLWLVLMKGQGIYSFVI